MSFHFSVVVRLKLQYLLIASFSATAWADGEHNNFLTRYAPAFAERYKPARTIVSNLNNPVGLSFATPAFRSARSGDSGKFLFIAEGGSQVTDPINPAASPIDVRARILRVPLYAPALTAGSNRLDGGTNQAGSPEVEVVLTQFPIGQHIDRKQLGHNTVSILGMTPVPQSDNLITLSSTGGEDAKQELVRRFGPTESQRKGDFSKPSGAADFKNQAPASGNAKTGVFGGSGKRFFFTNVRDNRLMYYEDGFSLQGGEKIYFDFGPEGPDLNVPGAGEIPARYPDAGMGLDVDPVTGTFFMRCTGNAGKWVRRESCG